MEKVVGAVGHEVFLGEELDRIGQQRVDEAEVGQPQPLAEPEDRGAIGADAVLNQGAAFALEPQQDDRQIQHHQQHDDRFDRADYQFSRHGRQARRSV